MNEHVESLNEILDRRFLELSLAKRNILLGKTDEQRKTLFKASVLLIYSATEGGVKELVRLLFDHINSCELTTLDLHINYLELSVSNECQLKQQILDHEKKIEAVNKIRKCMHTKVKMPGNIDVESNITPKIIKRICKSLNLKYFMENTHEKDLNILLRFRNNIAHGDSEMPIDYERINQFSNISTFIITEFSNGILEVLENKKWLELNIKLCNE